MLKKFLILCNQEYFDICNQNSLLMNNIFLNVYLRKFIKPGYYNVLKKLISLKIKTKKHCFQK